MTRLHWWMSLTLGWFKKHLQKIISDSLNPKIGMVEVFGESVVTWSVTRHQTGEQRDKIATKSKNLFHLISWSVVSAWNFISFSTNVGSDLCQDEIPHVLQTTPILWCMLMRGEKQGSMTCTDEWVLNPQKDSRNTSRTAWILKTDN